MVIMSEKVLVIQTYIDDESWSEMNWSVQALTEVKPADELTILGIVRHVNPPNPLSLPQKLFGYKVKEDQVNSIGSTKQVGEELRRRNAELQKNPGVIELQKLFDIEKKVKLRVELVEAGSSAKLAALRAAKRFGSTWIILDREMKREKQYFMDRLFCKISCIKSNESIVLVRDHVAIEYTQDDDDHCTYNQMIPSYSWEELSPPSSINGVTTTSSMTETSKCSTGADELSYSEYNCSKYIESLWLGDDSIQPSMVEYFEKSVCSVCQNKRPPIKWQQKNFSYLELHEATKGFSRENYLSEGGFGSVFKGKLKDGLEIAVKQHKAASLQGEKEFCSEVRVLGQARHPNLVMLLGSCTEGSHRLLVYEYVCNGSLEQHLTDADDIIEPLNWEDRVKIALGAAEGLRYLHTRTIVHRDMRPNNILITHDHESLLGDFGLAKAAQEDEMENGVVGTLGYVAPEYAESGKMSTKTDVYSFGVVLLQLITGLQSNHNILQGKSLIGWAKPLLKAKNYPDLVDKRISEFHDVHQLFWMVTTAEQCLKKDPNQRCTMEQVVQSLTFIKEGNVNSIAGVSQRT